jgi:hypothetical protein
VPSRRAKLINGTRIERGEAYLTSGCRRIIFSMKAHKENKTRSGNTPASERLGTITPPRHERPSEERHTRRSAYLIQNSRFMGSFSHPLSLSCNILSYNILQLGIVNPYV